MTIKIASVRLAGLYGFGAIVLLCATPALASFWNVQPSDQTKEVVARLKGIPALQSLTQTGSCSSQLPFAKGYPPGNWCKYAAGDIEVSIASVRKTGTVFSVSVSKQSDFGPIDGFPLDEMDTLKLYRALCPNVPMERAESATARLPQRLSGSLWTRHDDREKKRVSATSEINGASRRLAIEDVRECRAEATETNERGLRRVLLRFWR